MEIAMSALSKLITRLAPVLVLVTGCRSGSAEPPRPEAAVETNATIVHVVDGDTVDVSVHGRRERVRLLGIDTPETKDPDKPVQCYGLEAVQLTEALLPEGSAVRLERDAEARDDYGRLLAYIYRGQDDLFVNVELASRGAAVALSIPPNVTHADEIAAAVDAARRAGRGLWRACTDG
jgi:endonuclease YncB( thermonuclease family)